ncbi:myomegalin-like isoform X1 [Sinocyclocheilus rhinocerous]|uniref:myomegalin-like isoform X1 n=1 Tax=Sinocyclocheilus rhinocerous TaxID=307959 RepID=UPI0007B8A75E|nr:PREDICTED: myomegalin-like isoform X1 [Sinocyclocheilus rhinocerous]
MLDSKMKDVCRICARELNGNQRRWIFHPTAKLSLQVLLSYALGREMTRDGRGEFACSKCAFMLDRMYRFDTVIARVEALSVERMQKLLLEKDRLRQCIGGLYRKNNADDFGVDSGAADSSVVDFSRLAEAEYNALLQEDLAYSVYESWAEHDTQEQVQDHQCLVHQCHAAADATLGSRPRKCKGCAALRVADSDYEAVCKVPRKVGRSTSCGPSTHYSGSVQDSAEEAISSAPPPETEPDENNQSRQPSDPEPVCVSPASSVESLDTAVDVTQESNPKVHPNTVQGESEEERSAIKMPSSVCGIDMALSLLKSFEYHPLQSHRGSRIPVLLKPITTPMESSYPLLQVSSIGIECPISPHLPDAPSSIQQELQLELAEMEELWLDDYVQCKPLGLQKRLIEEQQCQLAEYENTAGQCVSELQKAQQQVQSLQTKIRESEGSNKKLQHRLGDMERELRSLREAACGQERTIQTLSDSLNTKDCEITDLHQLIEEQKELLHSLKQQNNHYQLQQQQVSGVAPSRLQADLLDLQGSLFSAQLELQGLQRTQQQGQRREEDLARANQRLQADLQRALQHHQEAERHNQDLQAALEKARFEVQQMEEKWRDEWKQREKEAEERKRTIRELKTSLEHKEHLIEDYSEPVDGQKEPAGSRDNLIHKLKQRIQERDRALERAIDDKFTCMEQKEDEVRKLQLLLREKERDLVKLRCVLSNNEETITSLELLLRGKGLALEQVCEAWHNAQSVQREKEESHMRSLRERDTLISQLQTSLHTRTKEAEEMTAVLLSEMSVGSNEVAEELKSRLQLKEHLFQELLSDRNRQTQEHHSQVQDLLNTINAREQYIRDSAGRVGQVMAEQTARLQELRRQLGSTNPQSTEADTQTLQDELRLTLRREREAQNQLTALHVTLASLQDQLKTQASDIEALSRTVSIKEEIIKDLQMQLVDPSDLPLVEQLTQELQMLREKVEHQDATCINHKQAILDPLVSMETGHAAKSHADFGGFTSDDGEEDDEDCNSEFADSAEDEERSKLTAQSLVSVQSCDQHRGLKGCQDAVAEGPGLVEVKLLVEQRRAVERELMELKSQLEKAGFSSLSQMRKAFFTICSENEELKIMVTGRKPQNDGQKSTSDGQLVDAVGVEPNEREPMCDQTVRLKSDLEQVQQESRELQERLMVSEAIVQAQAKQLKDYRELLTETSVQQDNKQVQVDIQDLGYETCGRSENEAEREDTSSPEFDDLELCTSLSYRDGGSQWWGGPSSLNSGKTKHDVTDLRGQLSQSQALIRSLQAQTRDHTPVSTPRKVNWGLDNSEAQSTAEEDEGWQSSDGFGSLPHQPKQDRELQELVSRVTSLEEQLRKGKGHSEDGKAVNWPGKFDTLIQAQARELSHLRQRMREGRGVCHILTQHLGDTTKAFEELLRSNDIDYYMGQSFRDQLSQSISLAQRVSTKISGRDHSEVPDDKSGHELLAIRLSKELQQKDKLIESLRSKLDQQQPRSDTPTSSHALSVATDQSDRTSFVSDGHGSTNEDLELCSELDAASEYGQEEAARSATDSCDHRGPASLHPSNPPSITSSHSHQSSNTCPSMHCTPHRPMETQAQTGLSTVPLSSSISFSTSLHCPKMSSVPVFDPQTQPLRTRHTYGGGFSLAEVHQELQMLQRQLGNNYHGPQIKPLPAFPLGSHTQPDHNSLHPLSHHAYEQSPFSSQHTSPAMKSGTSLLESSAMWDMMYGPRPLRPGTYGDVSSGSSGYQSGHTGADLMEEHLREIRTLRRCLEDSIQTNDHLRQQLEERLASSGRNGAGGAPTNIYIQGLDSISQLSNEIRALKQENHALQNQIQQTRTEGSKEMERLREVVLSGRGQLKQAELEADRWADQCRRLQAQNREQAQAVLQLKQEKQNSLDNSTRLQHEVNVLQQQLSECQCLMHTLQCELQVYQRVCGTTESNTGSGLSLTFDLRERESNINLLEQQLRKRLDQCMPHPSARKQLFHDQSPSPPVRDTGFFSPASPAVEPDDPKSSASDSSKSGGVALEVEAPDSSFACKTGRHMIGHMDDFSALQQQLLEGKAVIRKMEAALQSSTESPNLPEGYMRNLHTSTKTLKQILEETSSLLRIFWRAALPSTETSAQQLKKEQSLKKEVVTLRRKLSEQEQLLRDTMENLRTSSRTKDNMEQFIVNQLSRTRNVLKQARSNLEKNELKIASLGCTPLPSSFYSVSSTPSWSDRGEVSGASLQHASSLGWNFVSPHAQDQHKSVTASWLAQGSDRQRLLQVSCRTDSRLSAAVSPSF